MVKIIQKQGYFYLTNILQEEQKYQITAINYAEKAGNYWQKEQDIENHTNRLNYINYLIKNYSVGNLRQITTEYLEQKNVNIGMRK